ncbi:MAG TPA: hypothetical protein VF855_06565 [Acidimicrobiales bacterium]
MVSFVEDDSAMVAQWVEWARGQGMTADQLDDEPTFADLPDNVRGAVRAGLALDVPPPDEPAPPPPDDLGPPPDEAPPPVPVTADRGGRAGDPPPDWLQAILSGGGPLGNTDMSCLWWTRPMLGTEDVDGGVRLTATAGAFVGGQKWVPDAGRWFVGEWFIASGDTLGNGDLTFLNIDPPVRATPLDNVRVWYELDDNAVAEIDAGEDEHVADFEQAYLVSYQALEDAVAALRATTFASTNDAMDALATWLLEAGQGTLVPVDRHDPESWSARLAEVADRLESQSQKRDRSGEHSTVGYSSVANGLDVVLRPRFNNPHRPSSDVIKLSEVVRAT